MKTGVSSKPGWGVNREWGRGCRGVHERARAGGLADCSDPGGSLRNYENKGRVGEALTLTLDTYLNAQTPARRARRGFHRCTASLLCCSWFRTGTCKKESPCVEEANGQHQDKSGQPTGEGVCVCGGGSGGRGCMKKGCCSTRCLLRPRHPALHGKRLDRFSHPCANSTRSCMLNPAHLCRSYFRRQLGW